MLLDISLRQTRTWTTKTYKVVCFLMLDFETSNFKLEVSKSNFVENCFFLENYGTSEGAVSQNVLYYQPLSPLLVTKKGFMVITIIIFE